MSKTLLRHTLIKKIIFDIFVETLFKVSHTTVTNIFYCEEDIFGVIKEQNYYLNNKYASHVQRFQIVIFYLFLWTYVFFVVEVSFYFFLYIVFTPICFVKGGGSCFIDVICIYILSPELLLLDITRKYFWGTTICRNINPQSLEIFHILFSHIFQRSTTKLNITIKTAIQKSNRVIKMADRHAQG